MFYEWRLGERGWGYWMPIEWLTEGGIEIILDADRNLVVVGPIEVLADRQLRPHEAVFLAGTPNSVTIPDSSNLLIVLGSQGLRLRQSISPGTARRLRTALGSAFGEDVSRALYREFPQVESILSVPDETQDR